LGRVQVQVAAVLGEGRSSWAMPCTPYAGNDIGLFMVPPVGTNIWVEFEGGDPDYPIWSGCFWGDQELPEAARIEEPEQVQVFRTEGVTLIVSRKDGSKGITLEVQTPVVENPLKLIYNPDGIELNHSDTMTARFLTNGQTLELKNGQTSTVTLTADTIQLKEAAIEVQITNSSIELTCTPATLKLSTSSGIEMGNTPASVKVSASGVETSSGGLGKIAVSLGSVSINNGALEVT
jgi:uncharacterized protein involved in type VI secretion and phage assembly